MESGATRNYELWNDRRGEEEEVDEADDAMKALEARTQVGVWYKIKIKKRKQLRLTTPWRRSKHETRCVQNKN